MSVHLSNNIAYLRKVKGASQQQLADAMGVVRSAVANYEKGTSEPSLDKLLLLVKFFDVTVDEMLKKDLSKEPSKKEVQQAEPWVKYEVKKEVVPVVVTVDAGNNENIVLIDTKVAAGYPSNLTEPAFFKPLPVFSLPTKDFRNGTFRAFQVKGDSMEDTLKENSWVIARYCDNGAADVKNGYIYVVVTGESIQVKRCLNRLKERDSLVLQSDNAEYRPQTVPVEDIREVWYVKAHISFDLTNKRLDILHRLTRVEADLAFVLEKTVNS